MSRKIDIVWIFWSVNLESDSGDMVRYSGHMVRYYGDMVGYYGYWFISTLTDQSEAPN